jgi:hypothetical protein
VKAIESSVLSPATRTPDLGGTATTSQVGDAVGERLGETAAPALASRAVVAAADSPENG